MAHLDSSEYDERARTAAGYDYGGGVSPYPDYDGISEIPQWTEPADPGAAYTAPAYPTQGYDHPGYDHPGYDHPGYDHPGYDRPGYGTAGQVTPAYPTSGDLAPGDPAGHYVQPDLAGYHAPPDLAGYHAQPDPAGYHAQPGPVGQHTQHGPAGQHAQPDLAGYPGGLDLALEDGLPGGPGPAGGGRIGRSRADRRRDSQRSAGRAGRNMPAAIAVGVALGAAVLASLFVWRPAFIGVVAIAVGVGIGEMARAVAGRGARPPMVPLVAGGLLMTVLAWWGSADALAFGLIVTLLAVLVWRLADGSEGYERDVLAAALIAVYVPFLAGFAVMLARPEDGHLRVVIALACVVLSDTGGFIAGVLFGAHPMSPSVSPKKSWEGLAGSLVATAVGAALMLFFLFETTLWEGAVFGVGVSAAAVLGDLAESMIKRDLGIKDMSNLLPGHGGLMDRLDSILFAAPAAYALFMFVAPGT